MIPIGTRHQPFKSATFFLFTALAARQIVGAALAVVPCAPDAPDPAPKAHEYPARVIGFASATQVEIRTKAVEARTGWVVSEFYAAWPRIFAEIDEGHGQSIKSLVAHSPAFHPMIGDPIIAISRHRDPARACHFVPWTVRPLQATSQAEIFCLSANKATTCEF